MRCSPDCVFMASSYPAINPLELLLLYGYLQGHLLSGPLSAAMMLCSLA